MGYVEVGGNGSVIWNIEHDDGDYVQKKGVKDGGHGKDKNPAKNTGGTFIVMINGVEMAPIDLDTSKIVVTWGKHTPSTVPDGKKNVPMKEQPPPPAGTTS